MSGEPEAPASGGRRRAWLIGAASVGLIVAGFYGYRALGDWLTAQMTGKVKPPETAPGRLPSPPEAGEAPVVTSVREAPKAPALDVSGLDLIVKTAASAQASGKPMSREQLEAVRQAGVGMVDSLRPLLKDPAITAHMTAEQAGQYRQLMTLLDRAEKTAKSGGPPDFKRMAADVQKAQQLSLSLMSQLPQAAAAPEQPPR